MTEDNTPDVTAEPADDARRPESDEASLDREAALLAEKLPEWRDPEARRAGVEAMTRFLREEGFSAEDIAGLRDHRAVLLVRDAMRHRDAERARHDLAAKKVTPAPRVQRPGAAEEGDGPDGRLERLRRTARRTGRLDDRAAFVLAAIDG